MMYLVLAGIGAFAFVILIRVLWAKKQPKVSTKIIIGASIVLIGVLAILTGSGRFHPLAATVAAIAPFLRRGFFLLRLVPFFSNAFQMFQPGGSPFGFSSATQDQSQVSEAETDELKMVLDHSSGEISGTVKSGEFRGRELSSLSGAEVVRLYQSLQDEQSRRLMVSFIERYHPDIEQTSSQEESTGDDDTMTVKKAREVLGVAEDASEEDIVNAHRRMIQHLHPDRGGSSFIAAQINEAKRVLLDSLN